VKPQHAQHLLNGAVVALLLRRRQQHLLLNQRRRMIRLYLLKLRRAQQRSSAAVGQNHLFNAAVKPVHPLNEPAALLLRQFSVRAFLLNKSVALLLRQFSVRAFLLNKSVALLLRQFNVAVAQAFLYNAPAALALLHSVQVAPAAPALLHSVQVVLELNGNPMVGHKRNSVLAATAARPCSVRQIPLHSLDRPSVDPAAAGAGVHIPELPALAARFVQLRLVQVLAAPVLVVAQVHLYRGRQSGELLP
jgi:hypothetical protein